MHEKRGARAIRFTGASTSTNIPFRFRILGTYTSNIVYCIDSRFICHMGYNIIMVHRPDVYACHIYKYIISFCGVTVLYF